jgi:cytochrome c
MGSTSIVLRRISTAMGATLAFVAAAAAFASAHAQSPSDAAPGDAARGKTVYQACMGCHSLDEDDVGPRHRGVVGRVAGTVPGYAYSPALKRSGVVWNPANLDRWLTKPQGLVPGAKMFFSLANAKDRADVIAYLAQQR